MKTLVFALCYLLAPRIWAALPVYVESENGIGNGLKECTYSDGSLATINAHALCPASKNADADE